MAYALPLAQLGVSKKFCTRSRFNLLAGLWGAIWAYLRRISTLARAKVFPGHLAMNLSQFCANRGVHESRASEEQANKQCEVR